MKPVEHALECAARGWAVCPARPNKSPTPPRGHKDASVDPDLVRRLWQLHYGALVAIATGSASSLAVLDVDSQHGGILWWLANRHRLPATRTHRTRSGGLHLYFWHMPSLRCSTSKIAPGIDVKAEGGGVIYWPAAGFPVLCDAPLAAWPEWLVPPPKPAPAPSYEAAGQRPPNHVEAQLVGLVRTVATAPAGQRNACLFWAACRAAEMVERRELSKPHADEILIEAACRAGLDILEASRTIGSASTRRAA